MRFFSKEIVYAAGGTFLFSLSFISAMKTGQMDTSFTAAGLIMYFLWLGEVTSNLKVNNTAPDNKNT